MNKVQLTGRLTKDPDVRQNGETLIARYTLAVDRKDEADFISCVSFNKTADNIQKYLGKGSRVGACGSIRTGSYVNKDGAKVYTTDVVVNEIEFLDRKEKKEEPAAEPKQETLNDFLNSFAPVEGDSELPFN